MSKSKQKDYCSILFITLLLCSNHYATANETTERTPIRIQSHDNGEEYKKTENLYAIMAKEIAYSMRQTLEEVELAQRTTNINGMAGIAINGRAQGVVSNNQDDIYENRKGEYVIDLDVNILGDESLLTINEIMANYLSINLDPHSIDEKIGLTTYVGGYRYLRHERGQNFYGVHSIMLSGVELELRLEVGHQGDLQLVFASHNEFGADVIFGRDAGFYFNNRNTLSLELAKFTLSFLLDTKISSAQGADHLNLGIRVERQLNNNLSAFGELGVGSNQRPEMRLGVRAQLNNNRRNNKKN